MRIMTPTVGLYWQALSRKHLVQMIEKGTKLYVCFIQVRFYINTFRLAKSTVAVLSMSVGPS